MRRLNLVAVLGVVVGVGAVGCGSGSASDAEMAVEVVVPTVSIRELLGSASNSGLVATMRGPGQIGYLRPETTRERNEIVTTFRIQNISAGALAGFKVDEFWYDSDGETVTGDSVRMRRPFLVDEVIEVTLRVPRDSRMDRSNYEFSHQNGDIEANLVDELPDPIVEEEEGEEGEEAEEEAGA